MQRVMKLRETFLIILLTTICASVAFAGSGYDDCRKEEKRIRAAEAEQCSGLSYIFNPSACFNTRKALAPYTGGKCRSLVGTEAVEERKVEPAKPAVVEPSMQPARESSGEVSGQSVLMPASKSVAVDHPSELELLRREVAGLRAELELLKEEVAKLRGAR